MTSRLLPDLRATGAWSKISDKIRKITFYLQHKSIQKLYNEKKNSLTDQICKILQFVAKKIIFVSGSLQCRTDKMSAPMMQGMISDFVLGEQNDGVQGIVNGKNVMNKYLRRGSFS